MRRMISRELPNEYVIDVKHILLSSPVGLNQGSRTRCTYLFDVYMTTVNNVSDASTACGLHSSKSQVANL